MTNLLNHPRNDSFAAKMSLLQQAQADGKWELALSICDSIKDTLNLQIQSEGNRSPVHSAAQQYHEMHALPADWRAWAAGWSYAKLLRMAETVGIARRGEPVELAIALPMNQLSDPCREIRVARVTAEGTLAEIVSQVDDVRRVAGEFHCRVLFLADVPAHDSALFAVFYGNPFAEWPAYITDLQARGVGYGLDIENEFYVAQLSRQMGQIERLIFKREHGLELYAGGKGHGEPPMIDWGHDYVDEGAFQKFRLRNWEACRNFAVTLGPIRVSVRRWGFPHSPIHPVFTPARIHMDQGYSFWCGQPYFYKEGHIEVVQPVRIEAMRDDEWVFSGYSFTDTVWIDRWGMFHEGEVPAEHQRDLWGVGFRHKTSGDAFVALRLEHGSRHGPPIPHAGAPTLHYDGHGQLWSRYPYENIQLRPGTIVQQKTAYLMMKYDDAGSPYELEQTRHRLLHPLIVMPGEVPRSSSTDASPLRPCTPLARAGETAATGERKRAIWEALRSIKDEQLYQANTNIVDLGYVYDVRLQGTTAVVLVTMPHRGRPVYQFLEWKGGGRVSDGIRETLLKLDGIKQVVVECTWNPLWTVARLSPTALQALGKT